MNCYLREACWMLLEHWHCSSSKLSSLLNGIIEWLMFHNRRLLMFHPTRARRERRQQEKRRIGVVVLLCTKKTVIMTIALRLCLKVKIHDMTCSLSELWVLSRVLFLDTQVSLAPTHVSPSVCPSACKWYFWIAIAPEHFCTTVVFYDPPPKKKKKIVFERLKSSKMYMKA